MKTINSMQGLTTPKITLLNNAYDLSITEFLDSRKQNQKSRLQYLVRVMSKCCLPISLFNFRYCVSFFDSPAMKFDVKFETLNEL